MDERFKRYATFNIERAEEGAAQLKRQDAIFRFSLIRDTLDAPVWGKVSNITPNLPYAGMAYTLHSLLRSVFEASNHHHETTYSDDAAEKWRSEVVQHLRELQYLFARQPHQLREIDEILQRGQIEKRRLIMETLEKAHPAPLGSIWPAAFSFFNSFDVLRDISLATQQANIKATNIPDRPGTTDSEIANNKIIRRRFCLEISSYLPDGIPRKDQIISSFANIIFPDPEGSVLRPSQVVRLKGEKFSQWRIGEFEAFANAYKLYNELPFSVQKICAELTSSFSVNDK